MWPASVHTQRISSTPHTLLLTVTKHCKQHTQLFANRGVATSRWIEGIWRQNMTHIVTDLWPQERVSTYCTCTHVAPPSNLTVTSDSPHTVPTATKCSFIAEHKNEVGTSVHHAPCEATSSQKSILLHDVCRSPWTELSRGCKCRCVPMPAYDTHAGLLFKSNERVPRVSCTLPQNVLSACSLAVQNWTSLLETSARICKLLPRLVSLKLRLFFQPLYLAHRAPKKKHAVLHYNSHYQKNQSLLYAAWKGDAEWVRFYTSVK
jgi:hypothetical protein